MKLKHKLAYAIEIITNKKCENCKYNSFIFCERKDKNGEKCREKLYPCGFELKEQK